MAPANHSDDLALHASAISGLFRVLLTGGSLGRTDVLSLPSAAAAAGLSEEQCRQFFAGSLSLAPHQSMVLVTTLLERQRALQVERARSVVGTAVPVASESSAEGAEAAVKQLERDFPSWRFAVPDGVRDLGTDRPAKLIWRASHEGSQAVVHGVSAAELRRRVEGHEAARAVAAKRFAAYAKG